MQIIFVKSPKGFKIIVCKGEWKSGRVIIYHSEFNVDLNQILPNESCWLVLFHVCGPEWPEHCEECFLHWIIEMLMVQRRCVFWVEILKMNSNFELIKGGEDWLAYILLWDLLTLKQAISSCGKFGKSYNDGGPGLSRKISYTKVWIHWSVVVKFITNLIKACDLLSTSTSRTKLCKRLWVCCYSTIS